MLNNYDKLEFYTCKEVRGTLWGMLAMTAVHKPLDLPVHVHDYLSIFPS